MLLNTNVLNLTVLGWCLTHQVVDAAPSSVVNIVGGQNVELSPPRIAGFGNDDVPETRQIRDGRFDAVQAGAISSLDTPQFDA